MSLSEQVLRELTAVVGERNISVSERMADNRSPAMAGFGVTPFSSYIFATIVAVDPSG